MSLELDLQIFVQNLERDLKNVLENEVAEDIRGQMSGYLEKYKYTQSRGKDGSGVRDKRNFIADVEEHNSEFTLTIEDIADFQNEEDRNKGISLAEVVETGDSRFYMPRPRPFIAPTQDYLDNGAAERLIENGLKKLGYIVSH